MSLKFKPNKRGTTIFQNDNSDDDILLNPTGGCSKEEVFKIMGYGNNYKTVITDKTNLTNDLTDKTNLTNDLTNDLTNKTNLTNNLTNKNILTNDLTITFAKKSKNKLSTITYENASEEQTKTNKKPFTKPRLKKKSNELSNNLQKIENTQETNTNNEEELKQEIVEVIVMKEIRNYNGNINNIYHISDIHMCNDRKRDDEYDKILMQIYEKIKNDTSEKIIVITGDTFHDKDLATPDTFVKVINMLYKMRELCKVILILGNHDTISINSNNKTPIDVIMHDRKDLSINILNENKEYEIEGIENIVFVLTTMNSNEVTKFERKEGKYYIGLYHGIIQKSNYQNNCSVPKIKKYFSSNDFINFDLTLLGDIHKHQYLDEQKTIAYSGSILQRNFGETIDGHGIIKWNLKDNISEFIELKNEYAYITHHITDINNYNIIECLNKKFIRLKAKYGCKDLPNINEYLKKINETYNIILLRQEIIPSENNNIKTNVLQQNEITLFDLCKDYMENHILLKKNNNIGSVEEDIEHNENDENEEDILYDENGKCITCKLNKQEQEIVNKIVENDILTEQRSNEILEQMKIIIENTQSSDEFKKNGELFKQNNDMSLEFLKVSNLFSYSELEIDFKTMEGLYLIFGDNASGKSNLIDCITFAIYGKSSRSKGNNVIKYHEKSGDTEIIIKFNKSIWTIKRHLVRDGHHSNVYLYENGTEISSDKIDLENKIKTIFGDYDYLCSTSLLLFNCENFTDLTDFEKLKKLLKFFGFSVYTYVVKTNKRLKNNALKMLKKNINVKDDKFFIDEIKKYNDNLVLLENNYEILSNNENVISGKIMIIEKDIDSYFCKNIENVNNEFKTTKNKLKIIEQKLEIHKNTKIDDIDNDLIIVNNKIIDLEILIKNKQQELKNIVKVNMFDVTNIKNNLTTLINENNELTNLLKNNELNIKKIKKEYNLKKNTQYDVIINDEQNNLIKLKNQLETNEKNKLSIEFIQTTNINLLNYSFNSECICCTKNNEKHNEIKTQIKTLRETLNLVNESTLRNLHDNTIKKINEINHIQLLINENEQLKLKILSNEQTLKQYKEIIEDNLNMVKINDTNLENIKNNDNINKIIKDKTYEKMILEKEKEEKIDIKMIILEQTNIIDKYNEKINNLKQQIDNHDLTYELRNMLYKQQTLKQNIMNERKKIKNDIAILNEKIWNITIEQKNALLLNNELKKQKLELSNYLKIEEYFGNKFLHYIMNAKLRILESMMNNITEEISNYSIRFVEERESIKMLQIKETSDGIEELDARTLSGFEHSLMNISMRISLKTMGISTQNFLIIDEGISTSDEKNIEKVIDMLDMITSKYKICLLSTHIELLKTRIRKKITVSKNNSNSSSIHIL